jgi:hypothetical protein
MQQQQHAAAAAAACSSSSSSGIAYEIVLILLHACSQVVYA